VCRGRGVVFPAGGRRVLAGSVVTIPVSRVLMMKSKSDASRGSGGLKLATVPFTIGVRRTGHRAREFTCLIGLKI